MIGFGLDLSGYGRQGGTVVTGLIIEGGTATAHIIEDSAFAARLRGSDKLNVQIASESAELERMCKKGRVAVDVAIDLQKLPSPKSAQKVWQLTHRPIDRAFGALPPFSEKLGYCVARFLFLRNICTDFDLGRRIFETYPAASLKILGLPHRGYKTGDESLGVRKTIKTAFKIDDDSISHDELDSILCAVTALAESENLLEKGKLQIEMMKRLKEKGEDCLYDIPDGYRLLWKMPVFKKIVVKHSSWSALS